MKKSILALLFINSFAFAQVGIGTTAPTGALDVSSALPLPSTQKAGMVPPIVALSATNSTVTATAGVSVINPNTLGVPANGTIVYNTATSAAGANQVTPGYYFYNGTSWEKFTSGATTDWSLTGNAGTSAATNYIGTSDAVDLVLKTANTERLRVNNAVSAITGTAGDISIGDATSGTLKSTKEMVLRMDGDTYGSSVFRLRNRAGENGAVFENLDPNAGANLVDFVFKTGASAAPTKSNIRYETRAASTKMASNATEWQFGQPDTSNGGPTLVIGASGTGSNSAFLIGNVGIGTSTPNAKFHNDGTTAFTTATAGTNNTVILASANISLPAANVSNGVFYIIRNITAATNITVASIIPYTSTAPGAFILTPTIGSITVISNGTNWYRID